VEKIVIIIMDKKGIVKPKNAEKKMKKKWIFFRSRCSIFISYPRQNVDFVDNL